MGKKAMSPVLSSPFFFYQKTTDVTEALLGFFPDFRGTDSNTARSTSLSVIPFSSKPRRGKHSFSSRSRTSFLQTEEGQCFSSRCR